MGGGGEDWRNDEANWSHILYLRQQQNIWLKMLVRKEASKWESEASKSKPIYIPHGKNMYRQ